VWWWVLGQADKGLGSKQIIINVASAHLSTSTLGKGLTAPLRRKGTDELAQKKSERGLRKIGWGTGNHKGF